MFVNAFNSCDVNKISKIFKNHCVDGVKVYAIYEGVNNPYGGKELLTESVETNINMWKNLVKSAPDFLFTLGKTTAAYDPETMFCVIESPFDWFGTRVLDIKVAEKENQAIIDQKLADSSKYEIEIDHLMMELYDDLAIMEENYDMFSNLEENSLATTEPAAIDVENPENLEKEEKNETEADKSLFEKESVTTLKNAEFSVNPLPTKMKMVCKGTMTLHLNSDNKVEKIYFRYTAMDEKKI